jgi:hypothetical protein
MTKIIFETPVFEKVLGSGSGSFRKEPFKMNGVVFGALGRPRVKMLL